MRSGHTRVKAPSARVFAVAKVLIICVVAGPTFHAIVQACGGLWAPSTRHLAVCGRRRALKAVRELTAAFASSGTVIAGPVMPAPTIAGASSLSIGAPGRVGT